MIQRFGGYEDQERAFGKESAPSLVGEPKNPYLYEINGTMPTHTDVNSFWQEGADAMSTYWKPQVERLEAEIVKLRELIKIANSALDDLSDDCEVETQKLEFRIKELEAERKKQEAGFAHELSEWVKLNNSLHEKLKALESQLAEKPVSGDKTTEWLSEQVSLHFESGGLITDIVSQEQLKREGFMTEAIFKALASRQTTEETK